MHFILARFAPVVLSTWYIWQTANGTNELLWSGSAVYCVGLRRVCAESKLGCRLSYPSLFSIKYCTFKYSLTISPGNLVSWGLVVLNRQVKWFWIHWCKKQLNDNEKDLFWSQKHVREYWFTSVQKNLSIKDFCCLGELIYLQNWEIGASSWGTFPPLAFSFCTWVGGTGLWDWPVARYMAWTHRMRSCSSSLAKITVSPSFTALKNALPPSKPGRRGRQALKMATDVWRLWGWWQAPPGHPQPSCTGFTWQSQCSLCTRIDWLDACFYPCPDSVPIFPSPRHRYKPGSKVLTTNLLHLLSSPLRDIYPQHDEGKASNSLRLPRKDESPSPLVQLRSTPSHLFIVKSCIANDQPKHKHIYNDADHSSAASREKHPSRGLLGITSTHSRGWWCRTWLRVGVVHSVSVELQQLLRFSFFLPVAAHSKCILTNLKKITKLRWHRVIMTRNPNCAFIHWRGIGASGDHCSRGWTFITHSQSTLLTYPHSPCWYTQWFDFLPVRKNHALESSITHPQTSARVTPCHKQCELNC